MLSCEEVFRQLHNCGVRFFAGVPDSLLKEIGAYIADHSPAHVIAANEGAAVALAAGNYLATGSLGLVYLQNSGLGNAINPMVSLADPQVFGIPILCLLGWRGRPGTKDEPQHLKQGRITQALLEALEFPYHVLPSASHEAREIIQNAARTALERLIPYVLLAPEGIFEAYKSRKPTPNPYVLTRESAIRIVVDCLKREDVVVATTGKISRELAEYRKAMAQPQTDLLVVGSMGHASQIALGIALSRPDRKVVCLDGDGAAIMHMGALATIGAFKPANFMHFVLNNGVHESVGGQPTAGFSINLATVASACGYAQSVSVCSEDELRFQVSQPEAPTGPALVEVRVSAKSRADLGRPGATPAENKQTLMKHLGL